jgi:hypothetical protein
MADTVYNAFKARQLGATTPINPATDTIKLALLTSSYTPDFDAHDFFDDVSAFEVAASGTYSAGGATLTITASQDNTDNEGVMDASDPTFTSATINARYGVVYKSTGVASTSPLISLHDFGSNIVSTAGNFAVTFNSEGIVNIS